MRPRTLLLFALVALGGAAVAVLPALAAAPAEVKLEVNENCVASNWPCWTVAGSGLSNPKPASRVTIAAGGEIMFTDNTIINTNIAWTGTAPICESTVPVSPTSAKAHWSGKCKFEQAGTYRFEGSNLYYAYTKYEIVVEGGATGTTPTTPTTPSTPTTTTPTTPTTSSGPTHTSGSLLEGGSTALKLATSQRGSTVHGSIKVSQAGTGGRLEVGLFATGASLARAGHSQQVRVGRLVRSSLKAGTVSFSVPLSAKGQASLRRHRRLALTVKITLTPLTGAAARVSRRIVVHG